MSYAIFRVEPINKLSDLAQIGSHNKREKKAYKSNPDIDITKTKYNIDLVPLSEKYIKGFYNLTKEYKLEHDKRMEIMRDDRKKTFIQMVDDSNNVVADELLFTSDFDFFKGMSKKQIKKWADTCMEFVYNDLGYTKEQILHAPLHMDEKTPHIHCVVVPLIRKFDKRTNTEKWTISKKQYIKDKAHLSELQDKYYQRLIDNGFGLERGIKNSDNEHISIKEFKKITNKLDNRLEKQNYLMTRDYEKLQAENNRFHNLIHNILQTLKQFFHRLLKIGTEKDKDDVVLGIKEYYTQNLYDNFDLHDIVNDTSKEQEINDYLYSKDYDDKDIDI